MFFLEKFKNIVEYGARGRGAPRRRRDAARGQAHGLRRQVHRPSCGALPSTRCTPCAQKLGIFPVYKMIDTCAVGVLLLRALFLLDLRAGERVAGERPREDHRARLAARSASGRAWSSTIRPSTPIWTIRKAGYEAIIINNNPETVSTDYTTSDKLYFEPLTVEDVMNVIAPRKARGRRRLAGRPDGHQPGRAAGRSCGVPHHRHRRARPSTTPRTATAFEKIMEQLGIPQPQGEAVTDIEDGRARPPTQIGYPVLVRPSYVLGGRAMQIVSNEEALRALPADGRRGQRRLSRCWSTNTSWARSWRSTPSATAGTSSSPASWSWSSARASTPATRSASTRPSQRLATRSRRRSSTTPVKLGLGIGIVGLYNIQFIVRRQRRTSTSSRSTPVRRARCPSSRRPRACSWPTSPRSVILGHSLQRAGHHRAVLRPEKQRWYVKAPAFSFSKIRGRGRLPLAGDEVHRRGHRLRRQADPRALQGVAGLGHEGGQLRHGARSPSPTRTRRRRCRSSRRFYNLGFNIEATAGTARFPASSHGIRTRMRRKLSEGSERNPRFASARAT